MESVRPHAESRRRVGLAAFALALLAPPAAAETSDLGDPALGRELAAQLCSACHIVEPLHAGPVVDGVPTFMAIADELDDATIEALLLAQSHPVMPDPPLTNLERQHVIAHIRSLATD